MTDSKYFSGMQDAKVSDRANYMDPGYNYLLEIKRTFVLETREHGDAFISEFEIVETDNPNQKPGATVSYYQGLRRKDVAFGAIKLLVYAVLGLDRFKDAEKISTVVDPKITEFMDDAVQRNVLAKKRVRCRTETRTSKDKKIPFTNHYWSPV